MTALGRFTRREISSQPEAWAAGLQIVDSHRNDLDRFWCEGHYEEVIFTGCGSTYYLSLAAAAALQTLLDVPARGLPASEIWLSAPSFLFSRRTLLVAVSRSGATTETLRAAETFKAQNGTGLLTFSCYPKEKLATMGDLNLVLPSGREQSIAQTRSFSTLFLAATATATLWSRREDLFEELTRLPHACRRVLRDPCIEEVRQSGSDLGLNRFYFLGSGPRYGLACELSLKMKEMSLSHSEPFHFLEFRHGPMSMVTPEALIIALLSSSNREYELKVIQEMRARGAHILTIGEAAEDVAFHSGLHETVNNLLYLPVGQTLAFEHAIVKGLNPDAPANLGAVVRLAC